jgi:hypothetical protein
MIKFTPVTKTATNVLKVIAQAAKDRKIKPEQIDFDLLSFQTFFKSPKHKEWTLLDTKLENLFDDKMIRSSLLELRQEYEIRIRPYDQKYLPVKLDIKLTANKTKSKVIAIIKPENILPCIPDIKELIKSEIYKRKLRAGLLLGLFEDALDDDIMKLIDNSACDTPLKDEQRLIIALSPGPVAPVHDTIIYHYDKKAKSDNQMIDGVDANELIVEYIKPKRGKSGRSCSGQAIEVREPTTKYANYIKIDDSIIKREDENSITYFSKIPGYVKRDGGSFSISNEVSLKSASFKSTGSINPGEDKDIVVNIQGKKSSEDSIGSGVNIDVKELNVEGTVGSNVKVKAHELNVGEQTHRNSQLEAVEHAEVKLHRGRLKAKTAKIDILENGSVIADEVYVKKMLGGEIIAHRVVVDELISNTVITALESIEILSIFGTHNKLIIDPNKIENYPDKIADIKAEIKAKEIDFKESQLEYTNKYTKHKNLAPRIKTFQKKVLAATKSGKSPMKADVIRIKQYKKSAEALKELAQDIVTKEEEINSLKEELQKLYDADIHAKVIHKGVYDGQTKVTFVDTKTAQEYSITPKDKVETIFLEKVGEEKMINWK